jgi:NAD(P)H-dependent flavin oxidoreductase YrpB (nitropropane dioxygenase family)
MGLHTSPAMSVAIAKAGGLGSFPCSTFTAAQLRDLAGKLLAQTDRPASILAIVPRLRPSRQLKWAHMGEVITRAGVLRYRPPCGAMKSGSHRRF